MPPIPTRPRPGAPTARRRVLSHLLSAAVFSTVAAAAPAAPPLDLGDRRELFVDRYLIERLDGASLRLHHPQPAPPPVDPLPSPGAYGGYVYGTVFQDGALYRLYGRRDLKDAPQVTVYAESRDGIHWTEPDLGLYDNPKVPAGNIVLADEWGTVHNFTPFLDTRPGVPARHRYKAVGGSRLRPRAAADKAGPGGLRAYVSADGIRWTRLRDQPIIPNDWGAFDSQNLAFWSSAEQRYVCYFRVFDNKHSPGVRSVRRSTSEDFLTWTDPVDLRINLPRGGGPSRWRRTYEQLYVNNIKPYFRAPHLYIGLPMRINFDRNAPGEIVLATSRDGVNFDRTFAETFCRPGVKGFYGNRGHYFCHQLVQTGPTELSFYTYQVRRWTLRLDGFASLYAGLAGGEMTTRPLTFRGNRLEINAAAGAMGFVKVEIQGADGQPISGFTLADAVPFVGDEVAHVVAWKGGPDVGKLAGKPIRLRFVLKDADVFSLEFSR